LVNRAQVVDEVGKNLDKQVASPDTASPPKRSSDHAKHYQRHIVVLRSAGRECLCRSENSPHGFGGSGSVAAFGELDQPGFAPLFEAYVHRFGNAVGEEHDQVSGLMAKDAPLITLWSKAEHRTARLQA
jgi:hypothetical protein